MTNAPRHFTPYIRVSTSRQGASGLGLDAQREATQNFVNRYGGVVDDVFVEIESGKKANRPELAKAIEHCKKTGSTLLVARLDRLARNLHFVTSLQQSKISFIAADNPDANSLVLHILASMAEYEAKLVSERTKAALRAAKARGTKLGNPRPNLEKLHQARRASARVFGESIQATIREIQAAGVAGLTGIARALNARGVTTATGKRFFPATVKLYVD